MMLYVKRCFFGTSLKSSTLNPIEWDAALLLGHETESHETVPCVQAISEFALKKKQAFAAMNVSDLVAWMITHERVWKNLPEEFKNQTEACQCLWKNLISVIPYLEVECQAPSD